MDDELLNSIVEEMGERRVGIDELNAADRLCLSIESLYAAYCCCR